MSMMQRETYKIVYYNKTGGLINVSNKGVALVEAYDGAEARLIFDDQYDIQEHPIASCTKL